MIRRQKFSDEELLALHAKGLSTSEAARVLGVLVCSVRSRAEVLELDMPDGRAKVRFTPEIDQRIIDCSLGLISKIKLKRELRVGIDRLERRAEELGVQFPADGPGDKGKGGKPAGDIREISVGRKDRLLERLQGGLR